MSSSAQIFLINCELNCGKYVEKQSQAGFATSGSQSNARTWERSGAHKLLNHKHSWRPVQNQQELLEERNNPFGFWGGTVAGGLCRDDVYAAQ